MEIASDKKVASTYGHLCEARGWRCLRPAWAEQDKEKQWGKQGQKSIQSLSAGLECSYQSPACGYTIRHREKIGAGKGRISKRLDLCGSHSLSGIVLPPCGCAQCPSTFSLFTRPSDADPVSLCIQGKWESCRRGAVVWNSSPLSLPHWLPISLELTAEITAASPSRCPFISLSLSHIFKARKLIKISKSIH